MYKSLPYSKLVQVCTVQIYLSPEAGTNMYKSLSHRKPVKTCIQSLSLSEIEIVCACTAPSPNDATPPLPPQKPGGWYRQQFLDNTVCVTIHAI